MPGLMAIGVGLSLNNARAVIEGLFGDLGTFARTPKHSIEDGHRPSPARRYHTIRSPLPWLEALLVAYFTLGIVLAVRLSL